MHFRVTARTILQLGAELISSDAIAFYELIKNAFDAKSRKVEVRVVVRIPQNEVNEIIRLILSDELKVDESLLKRLIGLLDLEAPESSELRKALEQSPRVDELLHLLREANFIIIKDQGDGMSLEELNDIYLTIGTRHRHKQRTGTETNDSSKERPVLGEKGLGRLSVMRLGEGLRVETTQKGETNYNLLEIDWTAFSHESDALLESISIEPRIGHIKEDPLSKGTTIRISKLRSIWTKSKLEEVARQQLGRFIDPFGKSNRDFIALWFNKQPIILSGVDKTLLNNAHAVVKAELIFDDFANPSLIGEIHYNTYDRHKTFALTGTHLASVITPDQKMEAATSTLKSLGSFRVELYWFNRQLLTKNQGVINAPYIKELVSTWGGGLMLYRDGFRVNPYGGPYDDWLNLDPVALGSPGYKLNRRQVVGKVDISSIDNPALLDQTNREGLRDNVEKQALVALLQYVIWKELKIFLDTIKEREQANIAALSLKEIEKRINVGQDKINQALNYLTNNYPELSEGSEVISTIKKVLEESNTLFKSAKASAEALEHRLSTTINLAGLGLMVDVIAHELNRVTHHAIQTINSISTQELSQRTLSSMTTLRAQLKTLQTRLKVLDPLGPSGRQHKTLVDLKKLIQDTLQHHFEQFKIHRIALVIEDSNTQSEWNMQAVPGMIVQVIENLISNSVYWIKQEQIINKLQNAKIKIKIDRENKIILFSDNGPGIPVSKKEDVFLPFVSTKPPGEGKGLGLYISREIAKYHGAALYLKEEGPNAKVLHTFVLDLQNSK